MRGDRSKDARHGEVAHPAAALVLNAALLTFDDQWLEIEQLRGMDQERFTHLREELRATHVLRRRGADVHVVPITHDAGRVGGETVSIRMSEYPELACFLFREALVRRMKERGRSLLRAVPVQVASISTNDALRLSTAARTASDVPELLDTIDNRVAYTFDARIFRPRSGGTPALAVPVVVVGVAAFNRITANVRDLSRYGVDVRGAYVGELRPVRDPRVDPELRLLGRIRSANGDRLTIETRDGIEQHNAATIYLEGTRSNARRILQRALHRSWQRAETELATRNSAIHEGDAWLGRVQKALETLRTEALELTPGLKCTVGALVDPTRWPTGPNTARMASPAVFVFDPAGRKMDESNSRGIRNFGPYSRLAPIPKVPRVCLICQASQQGICEQFLFKFLNGIPRSIFDRGFLRTYGFEDCQPVPYVARDGSARAYRDAVERALRDGVERSQREGSGKYAPWDLAIVQVEDRTHQLNGDENPYLIAKAFFLTHQIPVQQFRIETAKTPDAQLCWSLSNMALATYSKLGGVPWLLRADPTTTHELVIGMASTHIRRDRLDQGERLVGITTVFSGEGSYFLHTVSKAVPISEYSDAMLESLRNAISKVRLDRNWRRGDRVRLVVHAFKPLKNAEATAVKRLALELEEFDLEFAFVHVAGDSALQLFDRNSRGVPIGNSGVSKGRNVPARGWMVELSDRDLLVMATGPRELKRAIDGAPIPLHLHLHQESTFRDIGYLGQQVYFFASHSWRGFQPSPMPVSIAYSQQIARQMGRLGTTSRWNPDALCGRIGTTRWML